jgi:hypothetical protein
MRYPLLAIGAAASVAVIVAVAADPPKLGPEWTYDKEMKEYKKTMSTKVTRSGGGNTQGYYLDLRHDKVLAYDTDENISTGVRVNDTINLEIRRNPKGGPDTISVGINKCGYADLDGDGIWDGFCDSRGDSRRIYIRHDGAWVPVCDSKGGFTIPQLSFDGKTEYTWDGKEWVGRPVNR